MRSTLVLALCALLLVSGCKAREDAPAPATPASPAISLSPAPGLSAEAHAPEGDQLRLPACPDRPEDWLARSSGDGAPTGSGQPLVPEGASHARVCVFSPVGPPRPAPVQLDVQESAALAQLLNAAVMPGEIACTRELGPSYLVSFLLPNDAQSSVVVESFGCRLIQTGDRGVYLAPESALVMLRAAAAR